MANIQTERYNGKRFLKSKSMPEVTGRERENIKVTFFDGTAIYLQVEEREAFITFEKDGKREVIGILAQGKDQAPFFAQPAGCNLSLD